MHLTVAEPPRLPSSPDHTAWQIILEAEMPEADELLFMMEQAVQRTLRSAKLQAVLNWATQVVDCSEEFFHLAAKRAAALALVLERAFTRRGTASQRSKLCPCPWR